MPLSQQQIRRTLAAYMAVYPDSVSVLTPLTQALGQGALVTSRKEFDGHLTASAVVLGPDATVLLVHHRALERWLCPGGHLEEDDSDFTAAALRELAEETGVQAQDVEPVGSVPVHIDVHPIPANDAKGEPEHQHFDVRVLFRVRQPVKLTIQQEEVLGAAWRPFDDIAHITLRDRVMGAAQTFAVTGGDDTPSPTSSAAAARPRTWGAVARLRHLSREGSQMVLRRGGQHRCPRSWGFGAGGRTRP